MATLISQHWTYAKLGTEECRYKLLYDKSFEIQRLVECSKRHDTPGNYIHEFPVDL